MSVVPCLVIVAGMDAARADSAQRLSLADAEKIAIEHNTALDIAESAVTGAEERVEAARASRLPKASLEANAIFWDKELSFSLAIPGMMPPPGMEPEPITVRSRVTASATLTVTQTITPQIALGHVVALERAGLGAARQDQRRTELEIAYRAADGYLLVLLAKAAGDIAELRVNTLTTQLERARALAEGGVLQPVDVMRLEAALAAARQEVIRSRSQAALAQGGLALVLGLPSGQAVDAVDTFPEEPGPPNTTASAAVELAMSSRPDLAAMSFRISQAESGARASRAQLIPNLVALGQVQRSEGGGTFQAKNAWFVGLSLQWDVWDWGQRRHNYREALARAEQARLGSRQLHDQVRIEVDAAAQDAASAYESLAVARTGLKAAEEAFRIQNAQFEEGATTTTELLNAQAEVTQARLGYTAARFAYFRALVALARATGQLPTAVMQTI